MLVLIAAVVSLACVAASARRLWLAFGATGIDPRRLTAALRAKGGAQPALEDVERALARDPRTAWERDLVAALRSPGTGRVAEVNERLMDLEYAAYAWSRVPRVCASVATSAGFLLGFLALRQGLLEAEPGGGVEALIMRAVDAVAIGIAGASFCVATHIRAGKVAKERLAAVDELVVRLEGLEDEGRVV